MNTTRFGILLSRHVLHLFILALALAALHGCASFVPATDADSLRQRAEAYWKARLSGDRIAAFDYEEYKVRGVQTLQAYVKKSPPIFLKATITDVRITGESTGVVSLETTYTVPGLPSRTPFLQKMQDEWKVIDGRWYHVEQSPSPLQRKRQD